MTWMYNFGVETHYGAWVVSAFVFSLAAIAQALALVYTEAESSASEVWSM